MPRFARADMQLFCFGLLIMLSLSAIIVRLWELQVMRGDTYAAKIGGTSTVTVRIPSVRGEIRDRNGIPLVQNRASYNVNFYLPDMVSGYRQRNHGKVPIVYQRQTIHSMPKDVAQPDIVQIVNSGVIPRLEQLGLAKDYSSRLLQKHFYNETLVPFTYLGDIDFATIAKFSEHDVGLPGVDIDISPVRQYCYGALAAHLLGYVGKPVDISLLSDVQDFRFYQPDIEGKEQIEKTMDVYLRGKPGVRKLQANVKGVYDSEVQVTPPVPGANVYLTLDAHKQMIVEEALRNPCIGRAAAVVVDPNNGDIIAMASVPSFDPNIFIPQISGTAWRELSDDLASPAANRAVSGFPTGSTFKMVTALAGLTKGLAKRSYTCTGAVEYGGRLFHCHIAEKGGAHGTLTLVDAMKVSCNSFFYQYGNDAGGATIERIGHILGMGVKHNIGLTNEVGGIMPGPEWMKSRNPNQNWTSAQTANISIGQGDVLASPLQMAMAYAAVANGGIVYKPRLIRTVLNPDGTPLLDDAGRVAVPDEPKIYEDLSTHFTPEQIELVRKGLWSVVNADGGTGKAARVAGTVVSGKTGTAQASEHGKKEHIAWFCCFAPYDKPRYVVVVMVQGGEHGGSVAAPVAARILEQCFAYDAGKIKVALQPLTPARHSKPFQVIQALTPYPGSSAITPSDNDDDGGDGDTDSSTATVQLSNSTAKPDLKTEADEQGRVRKATRKAAAATPSPTPNPHRSLFERLFKSKPQPASRP